MPEQLSYYELIAEAGKHWAIGTKEEIQIAYDLLTESAPRFADEARYVYILNYRYCGAALLGKTDLAIEILQEAVDAGFFWAADYLRSDTDLESLQELPAFKQLVERCEQMRQAARAESKALLFPLPLPAQTGNALPLLLALHANTQNAENSITFWESAVEEGWLTALPQSSQIVRADAYVWDDLELGGKEIKDHYEELAGKHEIDTEKIVIGGFSKGGEMAVWAALMQIIPAAGFISVNPDGPFIKDIDKWLPLLDNLEGLAEIKGYFVAGENGPRLENIKALHKLLNSRGLACELVIAPDLATDFPEDFNQTLAEALQYFCES